MDLLNLGLPVQVYVVQERHQLLVRLNHVLVFHKQSLLRLILILACMELTLLQAFNLPEKVLSRPQAAYTHPHPPTHTQADMRTAKKKIK